jgi:hypothetical protein
LPQPDGGAAPTDGTSGGSTGGQDAGTAQPVDAGPTQLLVVHDLHAGGLSASVVYAHEIRAKNARYGRLVNVCDCDLPEQGRQDLRETGTIEAQEVHAHDVDVDWLEADIVYTHSLKKK